MNSKIFIVAKEQKHHNFYWSIYDSNIENWENSQSYWKRISEISSTSNTFLGITTYGRVTSEAFFENYVCIFVRHYNRENGKFELNLFRYDLANEIWKKINLRLPEHITNYFDAVVVQQTNDQVPPALVITSYIKNEIYIAKLNDEAENWEKTQNWENPIFSHDKVSVEPINAGATYEGGASSVHSLVIPCYLQTTYDEINLNDGLEFYYPTVIAAFAQVPNGTDTMNLILYSPNNEGIIYAISENKIKNRQIDITREMLIENENLYELAGESGFRGTANIRGGKGVLTLKDRIGNSNSKFLGASSHQIFWGNSVGKKFRQSLSSSSIHELNDTKFIKPLDGSGLEIYFLNENIFGSQCLSKLVNNQIERKLILRPESVDYFKFLNSNDEEYQKSLRIEGIKRAYFFNLASREDRRIPGTNLDYLDEAYYFLPIYISNQLQESGYFTKSLDWYRTIYDYEDTTPNNHEVFLTTFLTINVTDSEQYERINDWFHDPLNPHSFAKFRLFSYRKYTLTSIIGCLIEYADEEFTKDTSESLPRARTLYLTALELLNKEVLKKDKEKCSELVIEILNDIENSDQSSLYYELLKPALSRTTSNEVISLSEKALNIHRESDTNDELPYKAFAGSPLSANVKIEKT